MALGSKSLRIRQSDLQVKHRNNTEKIMNTVLLCGSLHVAYQAEYTMLCLNGCSHGVLLSRIGMASICVGEALWTSVSKASTVHGVVPSTSEGQRG